VVLTHAQFAFAEARDRHADGWQGCLDALAASILEKEI